MSSMKDNTNEISEIIKADIDVKSESEYLGTTPFWKLHEGKRVSKFKFIWESYQLENCKRILVRIEDAPKNQTLKWIYIHWDCKKE